MLRVVSLFLIVLFLTSSFAQISTANAALRVLENETRLVLAEKLATAELALENPAADFPARVRLEIVAPNDSVLAAQEISRKIERGKQTLSIPIDTSSVVLNSDALLWYRLRYEIAPENPSDARTGGIVSFSQILPEVFELRTISGVPLGEKLFRVRVQAVNPVNEQPVADVRLDGEIEIGNRGAPVKTQAKTDAEGLAFLDFNLPGFKMYADVDLKIVGKKNNLTREIEEGLDGVGGSLAKVVTDKPIYQPNQTVNLRLYSYNISQSPVKDDELTIEIENESDSETVFSEKVKTSRFGIASAAWKIPGGMRLGNYGISVKNTEDNVVANERIKITRYDLPNFYTEAKPDRAFYLPERKTARIEVGGKYLFGKPLVDAKVRIVAQETSDAEIFGEITGTLNDEGKFSAEIDLSKAFEKFEPSNYQHFKDFRFSAYVTDATTNRTESKSFDVRITNESIHVYLIGDTDDQSSRLPLQFYVSTFYADGTPAACEVGIYELIDRDADGKSITPELGKSLAKIKTNAFGAAKLKLPVQLPENKDTLDLKIIAADKQGLSGSLEREIDTDNRPAIQVETDKIVYRAGEPVKVSIRSSEPRGMVFVDVIKNEGLLDATQIKLKEGRAELVLPYREDFKNNIQIAAYFEKTGDYNELISGTKAVIYPTPTNLEVEARTDKDVYRPGEQVAVKFRARNAEKTFAETALGILVIDKAVEERARTESETSRDNAFLNRTFTSGMAEFFGQELLFGNLTVRDIKNLNLTKPLAPDLELAIEIALSGGRYRPQISRSRAFRDDLDKIFMPYFRAKMKPLAEALDKIYDEKGVFATDEKSLRALLLTKNINFGDLRDAWGSEFRTEFRIDEEYEKLAIWSLGADKRANTADDLIVLETGWRYFASVGRAIDKAMRDFTERTNGFILDYQTLRGEMLRQNINLDALRDAWGNPYQFEFTVDRTNYLLTVKSLGADGKADTLLLPYNRDDFMLWQSRSDYFMVTKGNLIKGFNDYVGKSKTFPRDEAEMRSILQAIGFNTDETKDAFGRSFYVQQKETAQLMNTYRYSAPNLKAIKQKILTFAVRSAGPDGIKGNYDDFELANFMGATREEEIEFKSPNLATGKKLIREKSVTTSSGAIAGTVYDPNGAVIPNAEVRVANALHTVARTVRSNDEGAFVIGNLPKDAYTIQISAPGFKVLIITNLTVEAGIALEIDAILEVGSVSETVSVESSVSVVDSTANYSQTNLVTNQKVFLVNSPNTPPTFTPRVRDYFAETIVWLPELVTDKKGAAEVKFKMADNLTTWKLYAVGSDEKGDFGVVEKELQTFQPFFAELDPPRVLTEGDRIDLPVPVRNYTDKRQKVSVSMAENDWSRVAGGAAQTIEIPANASANAIFNFQALAPVREGKQRVTAIARSDSDAIEKAVTVRPNGKEIVETRANLFEKETVFDVNFPANSFQNTRRAEIKIYPNMLAHVAESVDGLLERPHGCGEQTTSSTYPNLLILKIEKELGKEIEPRTKAQAQSYLEEGYKRLLNYQTDGGGFSYWGKSDAPDAALTAYVVRFLSDAEDFIDVDRGVVERAENWLLSQQKPDGSWESKRGNTEVSTAYIARALSLTVGTDARKRKALTAAVGFLEKRFAETSDAYALANLALVAQVAGDTETALRTAEKLEKLSQPDKESLFWSTQNTPFYGWGTPANLETTALVVQAFLKLKESGGQANDEQISRGLSFLLKNKDRFGVWYSTQTTVNVLDALILLQEVRAGGEKNRQEKTEIFVNGRKVQEFAAADGSLKKPFIFDASPFLSNDANRVEIKTSGELNLTMAQIVSKHYINWNETREDSRYFDLKIDFDRLQAKIGDEIVCRVRAEKKINQYGMMLTEIGLPPGADVDRASLEKAKSSGSFSNYDILPDRVVVYSWASSAPLDFSFKFRPRFGLTAQTAPSVVYDYYNDEARATAAPQKFEVK